MNRTLKMFAALAPLVAFAPVAAQSTSNAPVVAVLVFDNASIGKDKADYDGIGKGIADLMIVDLAAGAKVRVVDRARVQQLLEEQKLTKEGMVDPTTAIRLGKILNACYSIYGTYMRTGNGTVLTVHSTQNETSQVENSIKETTNSDDVLAHIAAASSKFMNQMRLNSCGGAAGTGRSADNSAAAQQQANAVTTPATTPPANSPVTASAPAKAVAINLYAKPLSQPEIQKMRSTTKLDARTMLIYSRALDAKDRKDNARARQLAQQVVDKYPGFSPAKDLIAAASAGN